MLRSHNQPNIEAENTALANVLVPLLYIKREYRPTNDWNMRRSFTIFFFHQKTNQKLFSISLSWSILWWRVFMNWIQSYNWMFVLNIQLVWEIEKVTNMSFSLKIVWVFFVNFTYIFFKLVKKILNILNL